MNPWFVFAGIFAIYFLGLATIGIMYSMPMPFIAFLAIILMLVSLIVGLVEESRNG